MSQHDSAAAARQESGWLGSLEEAVGGASFFHGLNADCRCTTGTPAHKRVASRIEVGSHVGPTAFHENPDEGTGHWQFAVVVHKARFASPNVRAQTERAL